MMQGRCGNGLSVKGVLLVIDCGDDQVVEGFSLFNIFSLKYLISFNTS